MSCTILYCASHIMWYVNGKIHYQKKCVCLEKNNPGKLMIMLQNALLIFFDHIATRLSAPYILSEMINKSTANDHYNITCQH